MGAPLLDEAATALLLLAGLAFALALFITLASSIEDCFVDLYWFAIRLVGDPEQAEARGLLAVPPPAERPLAVLVPAWQEAEVLPLSLGHLLATARYRDFRVFVGCYLNDPATRAAVERLAAADGRVVPVTVPRPGPSCKADCLNAVVAAALERERRDGWRFAGFVLQDAEDMAHPEALACFNRLLGRWHLVQLPVLPLAERLGALVGGHYLDEFAEMHGKELPVRNALSGVVPGSGVAVAYERDAFLTARADNGGEAFTDGALTEDYDLSLRLARLGTRHLFLRRVGAARRPQGTRRDLIGTRELFPHDLAGAVRQKARWIQGISFQAWERFGWQGPGALRYFLLRDRKVLLCGHASLFGHLGLLYLLTRALLADHAPFWAPPPLLPEDSLLWQLAAVNLGFLCYRLLLRHLWVWAVYGWGHLPLVLPRYLVGALVNYLALWRASRLFLRQRRDGRPIGWDKTRHAFPATAPAGPPRQSAGPAEAPAAAPGVAAAGRLEDAA